VSGTEPAPAALRRGATDEGALGGPLAARIARACYGEDARVEPISEVNNHVYRLRLRGGCRVLKFAKGDDGAAIRRELTLLAALRECGLPLPHVECEDGEGALLGRPFFIMRSAGEQTVADHLGRRTASELCTEMGRVLGRIHGVELCPSGTARMEGMAPTIDGREEVAGAYRLAEWAVSAGGLSARDMRRFAALPVPALEGQSLCHGDFHAVQCIVDGGRITAVVDWQSSRRGNPLHDLAVTHTYLDYYAAPECIRSFLDGYAEVAVVPSEYELAYRPVRVVQALALARVFQYQARQALAGRAMELARRYLREIPPA